MKSCYAVAAVCAAFALGFVAGRVHPETAAAASVNPTLGFTLHIDAERHFGDAHPAEVAHHWCKNLPGMMECMLFESDAPNARLVEVETIVKPATWQSFPAAERALWVYDKTEIPLVNVKFPDLTPAEAAKQLASDSGEYGKIWMLWDPLTTAQPIGKPSIVVIK